MVIRSFHNSLFWSKCSKNSPTTLLGHLYFYDFSTKCIAVFSWLGVRRTQTWLLHPQMLLTTGNRGGRSQKLESPIIYSSHQDFDLMNLSHLNKLLKLLFPLNFSLCLCSKTVQRICSRNWPSPCFEGERWLGVTLKRRSLY